MTARKSHDLPNPLGGVLQARNVFDVNKFVATAAVNEHAIPVKTVTVKTSTVPSAVGALHVPPNGDNHENQVQAPALGNRSAGRAARIKLKHLLLGIVLQVGSS